MTTDAIRARVTDLQNYIRSGRILDAMTEFYAPDVAMQENRKPPVVGLAVNIEREKQFLAQVKQFKRYEPTAVAVGDGVSMVEAVMEFVNLQDQLVRLEQVSVHRWRDGKIFHERFYYDSAS